MYFREGYTDQQPQQGYNEYQYHVHELQGSVMTADQNNPHQHRFCTVTGEVVPTGENDHVHQVVFQTDYSDDHYHYFSGTTSGVIPVGDRHVHYLSDQTSTDDGHSHPFQAATMIENPTGSGQEY